MRLHYYAPTVRSYCVGLHNGHGFGSLFAKLFSKIAASTASRAALRVAKTAGREAINSLNERGADIAKKAIVKGGEAASAFAARKIDAASKRAINAGLPKELVHSLSTAAQKGVQIAVKKGSDKLERKRKIVSEKIKAKRPRAFYDLENIIDSA